MIPATDTRVQTPNGRLISWNLGHNDEGMPATVFCGHPIDVQVSGEFHGAKVDFVAALDQDLPLDLLCAANRDRVTVAQPGLYPLPVRPVVLAPRTNGGDENTAITVTIFLGD